MTDSRPQVASGFMDFTRYYGRVVVWILAALGVYLLVGLQFKWFGEVWLVAERPIADTPAITVKGPKALFSREEIAVDTSKTYRLSAEVRTLPNSDETPSASVIYFGVQTFDAAGKELTSGPGTYRYAGALKMKLTSKEGWVRIGGLITGEGDSSHNEFRPNTRSIRLVLLPNYKSSDDTSVMIRNVEFSERLTLAP